MFLFWIQASEEVLMLEGKLLALVIIMLSALEEQVSEFFFGVFNYLKKGSKRIVTAKLSSRYCSLRITKANAITRRMWEKKKGHFWSLCHLLEETGLSMWLWGPWHSTWCGLHVQRHNRPRIFPPAPGLSKVGALLVGRPAELTLHT